jgi:RNA polymerase sigma-70 factor, ECF subfamily
LGAWEPGQPERDGEVAAAIRGEADALRAVWQANRRWVAAVLLAHKPRETELEDLLQEVAMAYVRMIGKLRDEATLKPWLRTIAINAARAAGRDATRRRQGMTWSRGSEVAGAAGAGQAADRAGGMSEPASRGAGPEEEIGQREAAERLVQLAAQLPDGYREPLILKAVRGMSYREIGRVMELPETTVETRIARGRRMLRELAQCEQPTTAGKGGVS